MCKVLSLLALAGAFSVPLLADTENASITAVEIDVEVENPSYTPGESIKTGDLPAGYNASASYRCLKGWDIFFTADYIYWNWGQESLQLGVLTPTDIFSGTKEAVFQSPGYASGFQTGLGFNMAGMDDWNLYSEYTWYKNSDTKSVTGTSSRPLQTFEGNLPFVDGTYTSHIHMKLDALDFLVKRPFYFGKKLTANFFMGLSALWITQKFNTSTQGTSSLWIAENTGGDNPIINETLLINSTSNLKHTSWGLGPQLGIDSNWILGYGLKVMANLSASFLYTRYNVNQTSQGNVDVDGSIRNFANSSRDLENYNVLRPVTYAFLGLGWNQGFSQDRYRLELSAGYDFNIYWNYNMTNYVPNQVTGDLYLQGLNVQARFDF